MGQSVNLSVYYFTDPEPQNFDEVSEYKIHEGMFVIQQGEHRYLIPIANIRYICERTE